MHCCIRWNREYIPVILETKPFRAKNTTEFAEAIINNFGKTPEHGAKPMLPNMHVTPTVFKLDQNQMMVSDEMQMKKNILSAWICLSKAPNNRNYIAKKCQRHAGVKFNLINISNRGTQVWPTGSVYTNLVNQYNVRFESIDGSPLNQQDIIGLYVSLSGDFKICSSNC